MDAPQPWSARSGVTERLDQSLDRQSCVCTRETARPGLLVGALLAPVGTFEQADCIEPCPLLFSNRPFGVKHFQTIHPCGVDVARGLVLLFGIGAWPFHHGIRGRGGTIFRTAFRQSNGRTKQTCGLTSSIVPRGTSFHCSVDLGFPPIACLCALHAAAVSLVQRNSVPSTQMRCIITASRRASATIAFFIPRRLAICMAHALSQDHFFECIMLCAAS